MNILVFNEAAWDDKNSFGNTISNFFCGNTWKSDSFYNFYVRNQMPDNKVNVVYYNLSAVDMIKGICKFHIKGRKFSTCDLQSKKIELERKHNAEQSRIDRIHQKRNNLIYYVHELVWRSGLWLNNDFKDFIQKASPDILFAFTTSPYILWPLIKYLKKNTHCKVILLAADDVYGSIDKMVLYRRRYWRRFFRSCIQAADKLYAISEEMAELYKARFSKDIVPLYKGCDLSEPQKQTLNNPLRIVYAGNLLYGRADTLALIASAVERANAEETKATLEIFTGTTITPEFSEKLNRSHSSRIIGSRPYEEIKRIMHTADIVLHVESFESKAIETVRYSFSTKIIDCLQSGVQVLGIGPGEVASIRYLKKVDGAIVADDIGQIEGTISGLIRHKDTLLINAKKTRQFAKKYHEIHEVQKRLRKDFQDLLTTNT